MLTNATKSPISVSAAPALDKDAQESLKKFEALVHKHISNKAKVSVAPDPDEVVIVFQAELGKDFHFPVESLVELQKNMEADEEALSITGNKNGTVIEFEYD
jgi:hypothetical protein